MSKAAVVLLIAAAFVCAQQTFEIRGTVIEAGTNHALEGVDVAILPGNGILAPGVEAIQMKTDSAGSFRYSTTKGGQYVVRVRKDGYTRTSASASGGVSDQRGTVFSVTNTAVDMRFELQRPGELAGQIVDDDTGAPLPKLKINVATWVSRNGRPRAGYGPRDTDAEGRFRLQVPAGPFIVGTMPQVAGKDHIVTGFTAEDAEKVDTDYRYEFFPGGPDVQLALPVQVTSGGSANFGTLRVKKQNVYRVHVKVDPASCPAGEPLSVTEVIQQFQLIQQPLTVPCGPFLLTNMTPGAYELQLRAGKAPDIVSGLLRFTLAEGNLALPMALSRGVSLTGTLVAAKDAGDMPLTNFTTSLGPVGGSAPASEVQPHPVDAAGRFTFLNIQPGSRRKMSVAGLGTQYFVKEIRYNGAAVPGGVFNFTGSGEFVIEIDRTPAVLTGTVMNRDKPVAGADVVFLRWPAEPFDDQAAVRHIAADAEGKFSLTGLASGEYRLFAVAAEDSDRAQQPQAWQRILTRAEKITLTRGDSQNLTVQVTDPGR